MKNIELTNKFAFVALTIAMVLLPVSARASVAEPPTVIVGQTTVTDSKGVTYYGGFTGNEAIYNDIDTQTNLAFNRSYLSGNDTCYSDITKLVRCFVKSYNSPSTAMSILTSRTSVGGDNIPKLEFSALLYPQNSAVGDVYGYLDNFSLWGRNLSQSKGNNTTADGSWNVANYNLNDAAQSSWLDKNGNQTEQFQEYKARIDILKGNSKTIANTDLAAPGEWWLENSGSTISPDSTDASLTEGGVWVVKNADGSGDLTISNKNTIFHKTGTIIVPGNLVINSASFTPSDANNDRLGFIVYGNVTVTGAGNINAPIFTLGTFLFKNVVNLELTGSFVAKDFSGSSSNGNVRIYYDQQLSKGWPPGFRYLNATPR